MNKEPHVRIIQTESIIFRLRTVAAIWFKDDDLLLLEEVFRRLVELERNPLPEEINASNPD